MTYELRHPKAAQSLSALEQRYAPDDKSLRPRNGVRYKVLAYMRVSNELQEGNFTFETQNARMLEKLDRSLGESCYDYELYQDDGLSGGYGPTATGIEKRTRGTLRKLEEKLASGDYDVLIVYKANRLFRSVRWMAQWTEDVILPSKVRFMSATEDFDLSTSQGLALLNMTALMDQSFRDGASERVKDAQATRAEHGYLLGPPPYGWEYEAKEEVVGGGRRGIVRNEERSEHVRFMMKKFRSGWGCGRIAAELNQRGVSAARGGKWDLGTIIRTIANPVHAGYVKSKRKGLIQGRHYEQRICELSTIEEIEQTRLLRKKSEHTNTHKAGSPHLLNGIADCAECGRRLYIYTGTSVYRAYRCIAGCSKGKATCTGVSIRADALENSVVNELARRAQEPSIRTILQEEAERAALGELGRNETDRIELTKSLQALQERRTRAIDFLTRDLMTESEFVVFQDGVREEETELRKRLEEAERAIASRETHALWVEKVQKAVQDFPLCWSHLDLEERKHILRTLMEFVKLRRQGRDAVVTMKIHFLPEQERRIPLESMRHMAARPTGVDALTRRKLALLYHLGQGKTQREAAIAMGLPVTNIYTITYQIRAALGTRDLQACYQMAQKRIESLLPNLPLGPTSQGKIHPITTTGVHTPVLNDSLMEVFPLLAQGASVAEVVKLKNLTRAAVDGRRKRIIDIFRVKTIFEARQKAVELGLLPG